MLLFTYWWVMIGTIIDEGWRLSRAVGNNVCEMRNCRESKDLVGYENSMFVEGGSELSDALFFIVTWMLGHGTYTRERFYIQCQWYEYYYSPLDILPSHSSHIFNTSTQSALKRDSVSNRWNIEWWARRNADTNRARTRSDLRVDPDCIFSIYGEVLEIVCVRSCMSSHEWHFVTACVAPCSRTYFYTPPSLTFFFFSSSSPTPLQYCSIRGVFFSPIDLPSINHPPPHLYQHAISTKRDGSVKFWNRCR